MRMGYIIAGLIVLLLITFGALVLRPGHDQTINQQGQASQQEQQ